jgi:hypothetical protein
MNKQIAALSLAFSALASLPVLADDDLGINVVLEGEVAPGVYGRVELGNDSHPDIYYPQPVVIVKDTKYAKYRPVYLHVPPGHAKNWSKHCKHYNACERPVYFVKSVEYEESYQREHDHDHDHDHDQHDNKKSNGKEKGKGNKHDKH